VGYIAAASGLVGYSLKESLNNSTLALIVSFLALGSALTIASHQDQIVGFSEYLTNELANHLPSGADKVITFDQSATNREHLPHNLGMSFAAQVILLCGPPIFIFFRNGDYFTSGAPLAFAALLLTAIAGGRLSMSYRYREGVMKRLMRKNATQHNP
jgi:hypothetical protein